MNTESYAKECGLRCRRIRQARNMSQQELADKMFTTPQNISKLEKEGISNIDTIKKLSEVLGQDLLTDERDIEGSVGEIGKEILFLILCNEGKLSFEELVVENMYGLSSKDVTNEVFKLERIGLCVREQYKDWNDKDADDLFITAKGIITLKNLSNNEEQSEEIIEALQEVRSYEVSVGEWGSMQEYIENNTVEKMVRSLTYKDLESLYMINYVKYLKEQYTHSYNDFLSCFDFDDTDGKLDWIPSRNCYHDILYRMACDLTESNLLDHFGKTRHILFAVEDIQHYSNLLFGEEEIIDKTRAWFSEEFPGEEEYDGISYLYKKVDEKWKEICETTHMEKNELYNWFMDVSPDSDDYRKFEEKYSEELCTDLDILIDLTDSLNTFTEHTQIPIDIIYDCQIPEGSQGTPIEWFSFDDIKRFVEENYLLPETEEEKKMLSILRQINREDPKTLQYFTFPEEWEANGLANLVRERCGIEKPFTSNPQ